MCISQIEPHLVNQYIVFTVLTVSALEIEDGSGKFTAGLAAGLAAGLTAYYQIQ
jgi:hypothetical protein